LSPSNGGPNQFITVPAPYGTYIYPASSSSTGTLNPAIQAMLLACFNNPAPFPDPCPMLPTDLLYSTGVQGVPFPAITTVTVTDLPEPSTLILSGAGLIGLLGRWRRPDRARRADGVSIIRRRARVELIFVIRRGPFRRDKTRGWQPVGVNFVRIRQTTAGSSRRALAHLRRTVRPARSLIVLIVVPERRRLPIFIIGARRSIPVIAGRWRRIVLRHCGSRGYGHRNRQRQ